MYYAICRECGYRTVHQTKQQVSDAIAEHGRENPACYSANVYNPDLMTPAMKKRIWEKLGFGR